VRRATGRRPFPLEAPEADVIEQDFALAERVEPHGIDAERTEPTSVEDDWIEPVPPDDQER